MSAQKNKRIHLVYGIVTGAAAILAGICFIAACLDIYYTGRAEGLSQIYSRQIVTEYFVKISIPVYVCLILVIGGMVLNLVLPTEKPRLKPEKNLPLILQRLQEKTDLANCDEQLRNAVAKEQKLRKSMVALCLGLLTFGLVMFLRYGTNPNNWASNSTPSMVSAMYRMLGCLTVPFLVTVFAVYRSRKSMATEIELMRQAATQAPKKAEKPAPKVRSNRTVNIVRIAIVAIGVVLVVLGACNEGTKDILTKAVNICTECVGLG